MFERWRLTGSSFNMISLRLSGVNCLQWRIQGRGPGDPPPYFSTKLRPEGQKKLFGDRPPTPPLSQGLDDRAPLYLKVWIRHWFVPLEHSLSSLGLGANHLIPELSWEKWALGWSWFNSGPYLGDPRPFSRQAYRLLTFFSISCKRDFYSLIFVQESSIPKHCVRSYCLFTNVLFNFELMFLSNRLTVSCHPKPPP